MALFAYLCPLHSLPRDRQIGLIRTNLPGIELDTPGMFIDTAEAAAKPLFDREGWSTLAAQLRPGDRVIVATGVVLWAGPKDFSAVTDRLEACGVTLVMVREALTLAPGSPELESLRVATRAVEILRSAGRSAAIRLGIAEKRRRGLRHCHHAPAGKRWIGRRGNQKLADDPDAVAVAAKVREWRQQGHTWAAISFHLRQHGVRRRAGLEWSADSLRCLLGASR